MPTHEEELAMRASSPLQPKTEVLQALVDTFNKHWPAGTPVDVVKDFGQIFTTKTTGPAWVLGGHTPVVSVDGISGGYLLARVTPRAPEPSATSALSHRVNQELLKQLSLSKQKLMAAQTEDVEVRDAVLELVDAIEALIALDA